MHVQVSLKMEIAATASLSEMEQQAMREALKQAVRQWEDQHPACPHCGAQAHRLEGTTRRVIATLFGRVTVQRRRFRCQQCGHRWCPAKSLFVAVSSSQCHVEKAQWRADQCGGDPSTDQPARPAAGGAAASGGGARLRL